MCKTAFCLVVGLFVLTFSVYAAGPVIITEFMASNTRSISDEDGDKSDWIELYNASTNTVNLAGWFLTDATNNLTKWQFPATHFPPNSYLVVFASNKDRRRIGSPLHTNFRLAEDGEYLALVQSNGVTVATAFHPVYPLQAPDVSYGYGSDARDTVLLSTGHLARALIPTNETGLAWTEIGFAEQGWQSGTTGVGYDTSPSGVDYNPLLGLNVGAMQNVNQTVYIRVPFVITNIAELDTVTLRMQYDDGFIAYLNGSTLIASDGAPTPPLYTSAATANRADATAITFNDFNVTPFRDFLRVGTNILALHGLNNGIGSSDLLVVPQLLARTRPTGNLVLRFFPLPTPGEPNNAGSAVLGPIIMDEQHTPAVPQDNENVQVTARVRASFLPVTSVVLRYRGMYAAEVEVPMFDDGAHADGAALDGIYGASIPATASAPGQMIRWYIRATDTSNVVTRLPSFSEPLRSPEYLGTIVSTPQGNNLPILHWFIQNATGADNANGTRASLFYLGEFYDNVGMNLHGQSSAGFPKKSYDIDFHRGYNFRWKTGEKRVDDVNLLTIYPDKAHIRNILAYETFRDAGTPYHFVVPVRVHQNGVFFSDAHLVENGDENYLERLGLDTQGALYKMYNTLNIAAGEKKTRKNEDTSDLQSLINGALLPPGGQRTAYLFDNVNIPEAINYLAAQTMTGNVDCCHKNYYLYRDTEGTGEWQILPWDIDLSFGRVWSSGTTYWDDALNANTGLTTGNNNTLMSALYGTPEIRQMYLRRLRTLMEELLQPPGTPASEGRYEKRADELLALIGPDAALDLARWGTWCCSAAGPFTQATIPVPANFLTMTQAVAQLKSYLPQRRTFLFSNQVVTAGGEIPAPHPPNALITIAHIEYSPASSNQAQEYIELRNNNSFAVDISRWRVSSGIDHTFIPGTVLPANSSLFLSPNVRAFRARTSGPRGGQGLFLQGNYQGQLSARGEMVRLQDQSGRLIAATNYPGAPSLLQRYLRITELMYHPSPMAGNTNSREEFEYIELKNIGPVVLDLNGARFTNGISFSFTSGPVSSLSPGQSILLVRNQSQFAARYGGAFSIAGQYEGSLDNSGERLQLLDAAGEEILDFSYDNLWYPITDGLGFSLVIADEQASPEDWNLRGQWRPSGALLGSPGTDDPTPPIFAPVVLNEALTRTLGVPDSVELFNPTTNAVDVSGWFLSDDFNTPHKYQIPNGTTLPAGGFRVFTESNFNATPGVPPAFALSSDGDEVYLFGADAVGNLTGYYDGFQFGAAEEGVSFGRHGTSDGRLHFVAQENVTLAASNSAPRVGPVVISEIMFHPPDIGTNDNTMDEFLELLNTSGNAVPLFDPALPTNSWRLSGGIAFVFPTNAALAAGEAALVLAFAPSNAEQLAAFRARYSVPTNVQVFGPYTGALNNRSEPIDLSKPTPPLPDHSIPYALVERVEYRDDAPWPRGADGFGYSLQRWDPALFGNDPANWVAANTSSGALTSTNGALPVITEAPGNATYLVGESATLTATVSGSAPFFFQWRLNGTNLPGATNLSLQFSNLQPSQAGSYELIVGNQLAVVFSSPAVLAVRFPIAIVQQPQTIDVRIAPDPAAAPSTNVTFTVIASSIAPIAFQWRRNGLDIAEATSSTLTITNVSTNDFSLYSVRMSDDVSSIESTSVWLYPLISPNFIETPIGQLVAVGNPVTLSALVSGFPPPFTFEWRLGAAVISTTIGQEPMSFYAFTAPTNVTTVSYRVVAKNRAFPSGRVSGFAPITTLADTNANGLPDTWEATYGSSLPFADLDGDGMLNWQEYRAGTDPTNALSLLKATSMAWSNLTVRIDFDAVSNKAYAVQYKTEVDGTNWSTLLRRAARRIDHLETIIDGPITSNRFYRVVSPP